MILSTDIDILLLFSDFSTDLNLLLSIDTCTKDILIIFYYTDKCVCGFMFHQ